MFDRYIICENDFKNVEEAGEMVGFQFHARLPYYRGLGVSMVENLGVTVNAEKFPREALRVTLHGNTYTLDEMEQEYKDRWEFGEEGTVTVQKPGGLPAGLHKLEMDVVLRVSYLPFLLSGNDAKVLPLAS